MVAPKGCLVVPIGFRADGTLRTLELTDSDELKVYVASTVLDDVLTALEKLDDLQKALISIDTDKLAVVVDVSVLPTGAAISANQGAQGSKGWVGGAWQRQPLSLGFSSRHTETFDGTSTGGASTWVESTPVPAGEIHVVKFINFYHNDPVARDVHLYIWDGSVSFLLEYYPTVSQWVSRINTVSCVMVEGDKIRWKVTGLADTKTATAQYWATRIDIDQ